MNAPLDDELSPKKRGLGRGLSALFEDEEATFSQADMDAAQQPGGTQRRVIGIAQVQAGKFQPRRRFDDASIEELANSIKQHGLIQPILVRALPGQDNQFEIVAGERRWRAAQRAQLHEVPVIIRELDDETTLEIALIENLQREDLNPLDEAQALRQLMDEFGHSHEKIAEMLGKSRSFVSNTIRLTDLSGPVAALVAEGKLSAGHARALLTLDSDDQQDLAKKIIALNLNVRQTEKMVNDHLGRPVKQKLDKIGKAVAKGAKTKDVNTLALEREVSNVLGMSVSIDMADGQAGALSVSFRTLDQLDEVLHRLSHNPGRLALKG